MEKPSTFERFNAWLSQSVTVKLFSIGFLILILLIPTSMLTSLINERQSLRDDATREVSSKWGADQTIGGPVFSIPFYREVKNEKGVSTYQKEFAHFLPDNINIQGKVVPENRHRGIYDVVLYKTVLHITGTFSYPDLASIGLDPSYCKPEESFLSVGLSDMKGINEAVTCKIGDTTLIFGPGIPSSDVFHSGMSSKFNPKPGSNLSFDMTVDLNGSSSINFLPFGKETTVDLSSPWTNPSFTGSFLPESPNNVKDDGFSAHWKVLQLNRNYPQAGIGAFIPSDSYVDGSSELSSFGVKLLLPVDEYQKNFRSVKYCLMFIILTYLAFFFFEIMNKKRIHPIQYLLVGFAICLFYVLLLSISEHLSFGTAYLIGALATVALISYYVKAIFKNTKLTALFSLLLLLLYGFFYSLLQLQDYSLLLGSIGLFFILAVIMTMTRKIDWYRNQQSG